VCLNIIITLKLCFFKRNLPSLILFLNSMLNYESNLYRSLLLIYHRFWSVALFLQEFRIAGVPTKIRTFQIVAHKLKWMTLFDFWMFAASAECLLNNLLSRICLLRFFKHNELKMSKTHFFQMVPRLYYCTGRKLFWQALEQYKVCIVESENLGCYPKTVTSAKFSYELNWAVSSTKEVDVGCLWYPSGT
jgi:hypothetical protein